MAKTSIELPLTNLKRFEKHLKSDPGTAAEIREEISSQYAKEQRKRYLKFSKGGGDWAALKPATRAAKMALGYSPDILVRTATAIANFVPKIKASAKGPFPFIAVFGSDVKYPSGKTVSQVLSYHNKGSRRLPRRQVLGPVSNRVKKRMAKAVIKIVKRRSNG